MPYDEVGPVRTRPSGNNTRVPSEMINDGPVPTNGGKFGQDGNKDDNKDDTKLDGSTNQRRRRRSIVDDDLHRSKKATDEEESEELRKKRDTDEVYLVR